MVVSQSVLACCWLFVLLRWNSGCSAFTGTTVLPRSSEVRKQHARPLQFRSGIRRRQQPSFQGSANVKHSRSLLSKLNVGGDVGDLLAAGQQDSNALSWKTMGDASVPIVGASAASHSSTTTTSTVVDDCVDTRTTENVIDSTTLSLWKRRLITTEDPWSIHKWAAIVYTVSSVVILGTGATRWIRTVVTTMPEDGSSMYFDPSSSTLPDSLAPWAVAFSVANVMMCVASVRMSFIHRQGDLTARNAFLGTAVSSLFSGFFFLWVSPFAPALFTNNNTVSQGCFALLLLLNTVFILDTLVKIPEVVEGRRDRKVETTPAVDHPLLFVRDALGYVLPIAWGLPVIGATGYQASFVHDRQWFLDYCQSIQVSTGFPFLASTAYLQVLASLAASYGALFVTLRDKKLINKQQELVGITLFSVPAMIWTIWVTVIFYQGFATINLQTV
jgi:hypothetical protein